MTIRRVTSEDAILVYLLAIGYLQETKVGSHDQTNTLRVKEMWAGVFYIWRRERAGQEHPIAPLAICTYKKTQHTWKVEMDSGEKLTLLDKGKVWDIANEEERLTATNAVKNIAAVRMRQKLV